MNRKPTTNRKFVIASAVTGVVLFGAAGFAAAAKGDSHPARVPSTVSVQNTTAATTDNTVTVSSVDDKGGLAGGHGADDATTSTVAGTVTSVDDHGTDAATENSIDDHGADDATESSVDDHGVDDATSTSIDDSGVDATSTSVDHHGNDAATSTSVDDHGHGGNGGHGSDD